MVLKASADLWNSLQDLVFPKACRHCGTYFDNGYSNILCVTCLAGVQHYHGLVCDHCGISLPENAFEGASQFRCEDCGDHPYYLDRVRAWGPYEGPLRILHHGFKFEGMEDLKVEMAGRLRTSIPGSFWEGVKALVPVPMSPEKERERGHNPAFGISTELSRVLGIETKELLKKTRATAPQMSLSKAQRLQNPSGAYAISLMTPIPTRLILVDDVFTTGATLEECAKVLKKSGAQWVGAIVFGRTPHQS